MGSAEVGVKRGRAPCSPRWTRDRGSGQCWGRGLPLGLSSGSRGVSLQAPAGPGAVGRHGHGQSSGGREAAGSKGKAGPSTVGATQARAAPVPGARADDDRWRDFMQTSQHGMDARRQAGLAPPLGFPGQRGCPLLWFHLLRKTGQQANSPPAVTHAIWAQVGDSAAALPTQRPARGLG